MSKFESPTHVGSHDIPKTLPARIVLDVINQIADPHDQANLRHGVRSRAIKVASAARLGPFTCCRLVFMLPVPVWTLRQDMTA